MKVVISGGRGFLGTFISRELVSKGYEVLSLGRRRWSHYSPGEPTSEGFFESSHSGLRQLLGRYSPKAALHLAATYSRTTGREDLDPVVVEPFRFGVHFLEAAGESGVESFTNLNSEWQLSEDLNFRNSPYLGSKLAFAGYLEARSSQFRTVNKVYVGETFGESDTRGKIISKLMEAKKEDTEIALSNPELLINLLSARELSFELSRILEATENMNLHLQSPDAVTPGALKQFFDELTHDHIPDIRTSPHMSPHTLDRREGVEALVARRLIPLNLQLAALWVDFMEQPRVEK